MVTLPTNHQRTCAPLSIPWRNSWLHVSQPIAISQRFNDPLYRTSPHPSFSTRQSTIVLEVLNVGTLMA
eukprot:7249447-Prorocentrum_lima.AAC.1